MSIIDLTESGSRSVLEDVCHRLIALATVLGAQAPDETGLRRAASELDALAHRVRWIADVTRASD